MGRVVAISRGDLDSTKYINEFIVFLSNLSNPKLLFIPTASEDSQGYIDKIHEHFGQLGCIVSELCLLTHTYGKERIKSMIKDADIIYVGGGDTIRMIEKWKEYDIDKYLIEAYEEGRKSFDEMMSNMDIPGLALENDTAFVEINGKFYIIK